MNIVTTSPQKRVGSAAERQVAQLVGGVRVGMDGGPVDVIVAGYMNVQVKNVKDLPGLKAISRMIDLMPDDVLRAVVVIERAGSGRRGVRTITFDLDAWREWHGSRD